jgi:hypothetical protein
MKQYLFWTEMNFLWTNIARDDGFMLWSDIALIEEVEKVLRGGGGTRGDLQKEYEEGNPWRKLSENLGEEKTENAELSKKPSLFVSFFIISKGKPLISFKTASGITNSTSTPLSFIFLARFTKASNFSIPSLLFLKHQIRKEASSTKTIFFPIVFPT